MRFKAILVEAAKKRYPLSILLIVIGILIIPFPYLFMRFALEQTGGWWTALGIVGGVVLGSVVIGLGSLVEDVHDISMHTAGYDLELGEEEDAAFEEEAPEEEKPAGEEGEETAEREPAE